MKSLSTWLTFLAFSVLIGVFLYLLGLFAENALLAHYYSKKAPYLQTISSRYESLEALPQNRIGENLKFINRSLSDESEERHLGLAFIVNYGAQWNALLLHSRVITSQQVFDKINRENRLVLTKKNYFLSEVGGYLVYKISHALPHAGIFYTAVAFKDPRFENQLKWVQISSLVLFGMLCLVFAIVLFTGGRKPSAFGGEPAEGYKVRSDEGRFQFSGVAPMEGSPFARPTEKPTGSRFFKDEYLAPKPETNEPQENRITEVFEPQIPSIQAEVAKPNKVESPVGIRSLEEVGEYRKKLESEIDELHVLREISLASNSISEMSAFLATILTILRSKVPAGAIEFFLVDKADNQILKRHSSITDYKVHHDDAGNLPSEHKILLEVGEEGRAIARQQTILLHLGEKDILTAPLVDKSRIIGAIRMSSGPGLSFAETDRFILLKLAKHVAVSLNNVALYDSAVRDGLTGLFGHKHFQLLLGEEIKKAERYKDNLSLALIDIDFFKKFNDNYGHQAGDAVLTQFSQVMLETMRQTDLAFRYGGEEFALLFMRADKAQVKETCERLRFVVENRNFVFQDKKLKVTISVGISSMDFRPISKETLIQEADRALYHAKERGRNQTRTFDEI